mgnify:CR=1 FL=1
MKNFKDIKKQVGLYESGEHTFGGGVQAPSGPTREISAASDEGVYYIQRNSQLNRINAFLDAFSRKEYIDPRGALGMLRAKLILTRKPASLMRECLSLESLDSVEHLVNHQPHHSMNLIIPMAFLSSMMVRDLI